MGASVRPVQSTASVRPAKTEGNRVKVEWMFADAGLGLLGLEQVATLNPLNWSGPITHMECIHQLEEVKSHPDSATRPILVKIPAGITTWEQRYNSIDDAIAYVRENSPEEEQRKLAELEEE